MSKQFPAQQQERQPGVEQEMTPQPEIIREDYRGSGKLEGRKALISGGDSGIGRTAAVHFAREGADVAIVYLDEHADAEETKRLIEAEGRQALLISGDMSDSDFCHRAVEQTLQAFGAINILVNNAAQQVVRADITDIPDDEWRHIFDVNIHGYFYMTKAVRPHLKAGDTIINTTSINPFVGNAKLMAYTSTKGAITGFTRSLSEALVGEGIRVNEVAPGPIWTPIQPATMGRFDPTLVETLGEKMPMGRAGQPSELGPAYVFLASKDASYISGHSLHINGGAIIN
ncbi:NAD(P)-dependent dehydrogenase (short-subunit alcohol dehydrogenase family) [Kushneria sinocarnis]|uniref:NAD(P)-dependent dehydrogenase (Short-subunit alcohol dehydrogenase family) n=1 Tax=Kushneria sinocarnis TaxID=595502 RepID=A0A420X0N3_9GAMM|nr:SDR family oxidoreductase [Kushneria sinocarnis]RKR07362.1 NAD(P)-dependent dehydrogenase (short-subunit alcohol dehydrogenase family) [Kushneria sinocarnis]